MELVYVGKYRCRCGKEVVLDLKGPGYKTLPPGWVRLIGTLHEGKEGVDLNPSFTVSVEICSKECMLAFVEDNLCNPELS